MFNFDWLAGLSTESATWILIALFSSMALWVARLPRSYVMEGSLDAPWWMDLRIWTLGLLAVLSAIYLYF